MVTNRFPIQVMCGISEGSTLSDGYRRVSAASFGRNGHNKDVLKKIHMPENGEKIRSIMKFS